jgi:hypothetical protein
VDGFEVDRKRLPVLDATTASDADVELRELYRAKK